MRAAWVIAILIAGAGPASPPPPALTGAPFDHCVAAGDTLDALAARFGVDAATIARRNAITRKTRLAPGAILRIDAVHIVPPSERTIVVNLPQRMLFLRTADGVRAYPVAAGRPSWPTPRGAFTVQVKETDPTWDVPPSIQEEMRRSGKPVLEHVPPSPQNPLGKFWLGLSLSGIGIHGTNAPLSIHRLVTHGCIRVHPDLIEELFALVPEGADGEIVYETLLVAASGGRVYVEVNPDAYGRGATTMARLREQTDCAGVTAVVDWARAAAALALREGVAVDITADGP